MTYNYSPEKPLSQGDILRGVKVISNIVGGTNNGPKFRESIVVIITRGCEIEKPMNSANSVLVARIARLSSQTERMQDQIRNGEILNAFYLPSSEEPWMEEAYADWRTLQPVSKEILFNLRLQPDIYKCTLNETTREALLEHYIEFLTKPDDEETVQGETTLVNVSNQAPPH